MKREKVFIVDDIEMNRLILEEILKDDYDIIQADNGITAIDILFNLKELPSIVLLDIMMPEMNGYEVLELMKSNAQTAHIPVFFITAADPSTNEEKGLTAGAVDYISKPFVPNIVKARIANHIELKQYRDNLEQMVEKKVNELTQTKEHILETMASIIEYRHLESGQHVRRTSQLTRLLINELVRNSKYSKELIESDFDVMIKAVPLHDIGKIGIPDSVLLKPGRLDPEEYEIIKTHAAIGGEIIKSLLLIDDTLYLKHCYDIVRHHHEWYNGNGYPDKLKGEEIPLSARILAVIDVYDALSSPRVYKASMGHEKSMQIICEGSGTQFDPEIIMAFVAIEKQVEQTALELQ